MVDAVHEKVERQSNGVVGEQGVHVEEEPVKDVLQDSPRDVAQEKCRDCVCKRDRGNAPGSDYLEGCTRVGGERRERVGAKRELDQGTNEEIRRNGQPYARDDVPRRTREDLYHPLGTTLGCESWKTHLQIPRAKQTRGLHKVARLVDLLQVIGLGEVGLPHLHEERSAEIEE